MAVLKAVDWSRQSFPYCYYVKVGVINPIIDITHPIESGMNYMVHRVNIAWPSENPALVGAFANPPKIEFIKEAGGLVLQNAPFDMSLITSPAESGIAVNTLPGANPAYPFTARELDRSMRLDTLYSFKDVLHLRISNITAITVPGDPNGSLPPYIEIFIIGRYHPDLTQTGWSM